MEKFGTEQGVMINFRVADLDRLLDQLREAGIQTGDEITTERGAGRFAWIKDPEGNAIELWEPEPGL